MRRSLPALVLVALSVLSASRASAQRIDACDVAWLDTLRLRAVLRVELASVRASATNGVTFVIDACTEVEAEVRLERAGRVLERRLVGVEDVAPNLRARLLAFVLAELVRISTGLESEPAIPEAPAPIAAVPAPYTPPASAPARGSTRRRAYVPVSDARADAPPILRQSFAREPVPDVSTPEERDAPLDTRTVVTMDTGIRWFPREWSRVSSTRARLTRKRFVLESRYSRGPLLYTEDELPSTFAAVEFSGGARLGRQGPRIDFDVALLASVGFIRPLSVDEGGVMSQTYDRTPLYGVTISFNVMRKLSSAVLTAGFDIGYVLGIDTARLPGGGPPVGDMRGLTFGLSMGIGLGTRGGT